MDDQIILAKQREFSRKLTERFVKTQGVEAFKLFFTDQIKRRNPKVGIVWGVKHVGPIRKLKEAYLPQELTALVKEFATQEKYHKGGISFDAFYLLHSTIAADVQKTIDTKNKKVAMVETLEKKDKSDLEDGDMDKFKESSFYKKLPEKWRQKLG